MEYEGWRDVHVGFEGDGLKIVGVKIWSAEWRRTDLDAVQLPHPAHQHQGKCSTSMGLGMGRIQFASQPVNYPTEYRDTTYRANSDVQGLGFVTRIVPTCNHDASSKVLDLGMAA